jgi:hypothetical protein
MHPDWIQRSPTVTKTDPARDCARRDRKIGARDGGARHVAATAIAARAAGIWLLIIAAEMVHGFARTRWLTPALGDFRARQVAVFSGSLIVLMIAIATVRWTRTTRTRALLGIGGLWVTLTTAFEVAVGRFLGFSWERLLSDYNLMQGGLLPIGLAVMCVAPLIAARLRALHSDRAEHADGGLRDPPTD